MPVIGLSPWLRYRRYSDNREVSGRLVERGGKRFIEVKEHLVENFRCPKCNELLTQGDTKAFPNFFLEPPIFHERHKPVQPGS